MSAPDPWEGLLDPGEEILWQGRPDAGVRIDTSRPMELLMGLFFMLFAVVWMNMASRAGGNFWMFGLIFFGIGFYNAIGVHLWKAHVRARTHYTLTNKRGFIATDVLGRRRLHSHAIDADSPVELTEGALSSVYFATERKRRKRGYSEIPVGFEQIADGREVYRHIRAIQQGRTGQGEQA